MNKLEIKQKREMLGITQVELAQILGVSPNTIQNWESGAKIPKTKINFIQEKMNELILSGDQGEYTDPAFAKAETSTTGVPYYDIDFTASFLEVENSQMTQPDAYIDHPFFKNCNYVVRASGQSMAKVIAHGDAIGLVKIDNWQEFFPLGEIYAIVTSNDFRMIKVITKGDTDDSYTLISKPTDGKKDDFPPQQIKKNNILHLFRVQASSHLF